MITKLIGGRVGNEIMKRRRKKADMTGNEIVCIDMARKKLKMAKMEWEEFRKEAQKVRQNYLLGRNK